MALSDEQRKYKILHINASDMIGGAARGGMKVFCGSQKSGFESRMYVRWKKSGRADIVKLCGNIFLAIIDRAAEIIGFVSGLQNCCYFSTFFLLRDSFLKEADLIQLYLTHKYFNITALPALSQQKPFVWRLSDMWALTGHCSYAYECDKWRTGCGKCPHLKEFPALLFDNTRFLWKLKKFIYSRSQISIVTPSRWLERLVRESPLLGSFPVRCIHTGVDCDIFRPMDRQAIRRDFGFSTDKKIILFSAYGVDNPRKGGEYLVQALELLTSEQRKDMVVILLGHHAENWAKELPADIECRALGFKEESVELARIYNLANVMAFPALAENFPNGILESLACGVPVVAFDVGGVPETVIHKKTGYLAKLRDSDDLRNGIMTFLGTPAIDEEKTRDACRASACENFSLRKQDEEFSNLYHDTIRAYEKQG